MGIQIFNAILTPYQVCCLHNCQDAGTPPFPLLSVPINTSQAVQVQVYSDQSKCKCTQRVHMYQQPLLIRTNDRFTEGSVLVNSTISQINAISIFTYSTYIVHERTKSQGTQKQVMEVHNLYSSADLIRVIIRRDQTGPTTLMH